MNLKTLSRPLFLFLLLVCAAASSRAENAAPLPFVAPLFSDNAILQRDHEVPIWGWTAPNANVTVTLGNEKFSTRAGATGKWMAKISAHPAGGPHALNIIGPSTPDNITLKNVMFGDVWICSGQSNMEWGVQQAQSAKEEIAAANFPNIRLLTIPKATALSPQNLFKGAWQVCSPETVAGFSAVGYFFGRKIHQETGVPIGLINSSWSGVVAEGWVSESGFENLPELKTWAEAVKDEGAHPLRFGEQVKAWYAANDPGTQGNWNLPETPDVDWPTTHVPALFDAAAGPLPKYDGIVWFRREFDVPAVWAGKDLILDLGRLDHQDTTYWNGETVGATDNYNDWRRYTIPGRLVKAGRNIVAIRILDFNEHGGFHDAAITVKPKVASDPVETPLILTGDWRYNASIASNKWKMFPISFVGDPNKPTELYNGMIHPLVPAAIKGAIWYQGESNAGRAKQYQTLLPALINDWRSHFSGGEFPFYIVQLANFTAPDEQPRDEGWTRLQEAQVIVSKSTPKTGLAVINDIGDEKDIHPQNKQDVGLRLALLALAKDYGKKVEYSGPTLKSHTVEGNKIVLKFDHANGGLTLRGDTSRVFAIAGEDKKWVWATPVINGDTITVSSPEVLAPVAVRFAWSNNPRATLHNGDCLPASLFRTDIW